MACALYSLIKPCIQKSSVPGLRLISLQYSNTFFFYISTCILHTTCKQGFHDSGKNKIHMCVGATKYKLYNIGDSAYIKLIY